MESSSGRAPAGLAALTLAALGVVFGDIGTSPLYALQSVFAVDGGIVQPTEANVYGVVSLIFWTITLIVSIKYVTFVMRADNDGEGGVLALVALVQRTLGPTHRATAKLVALGAVGAALFYGDSAITPALSVLSAVEGLKVVNPGLGEVVLPLTVATLTAAVRRGALGHRADRRPVRPGDAAVVRHSGARRDPPDRPTAGDPQGAVADVCAVVPRQ